MREPRLRETGAATTPALLPSIRRRVSWRFMELNIPFAIGRGTVSPMPTVAVATLMHESNSFNPALTRLEEFRIEKRDLEGWSQGNTEVAGFLNGAKTHELRCVPVFAATATPSGPVAESAFETLVDCLIKNLSAGGPYDGVYLALHGAMVAEHVPHADNEIVRRVREQIGPDLPLVVSHDFHANISPETVENCSALLTYQQNPHLDTKQRGERAAAILSRVIRNEVRPTQAIVKPPMIWNIVFQNTYAQPLLAITQDSIQLEQQDGVLAASVSAGYQYADVPFVGPSAVVVTDNNAQLALDEAQRLSDRLWSLRDHLQLNLPDPDNRGGRCYQGSRFPSRAVRRRR